MTAQAFHFTINGLRMNKLNTNSQFLIPRLPGTDEQYLSHKTVLVHFGGLLLRLNQV